MKWYHYDIRELTEEEYQKWYNLMSAEKKARVDRFRQPDDKKRTVAGEMLARKAIAQWCGVDTVSIKLDTTEHGKPFAVGLDVEFNISHSGDMVVCAISDQPVGIDIELIRPVDLRTAKHFCTPEDLEYLFGHTPSEDEFIKTEEEAILHRFFQIWTAKEAYCKCMGRGISAVGTISYATIQRRFEVKYYSKMYIVCSIIQTTRAVEFGV